MIKDLDGLKSLPELTTPEDGFDLLKEAAVNASVGKKDKLGGKDQFNCIVLHKVSDTPFSRSELSAIFGAVIGEGTSEYYGYRVRITDEDSPHAFYPIPCDLSSANDTSVPLVIASMHTLIATTEELEELDTCIVKFNKVGGKYDLSYGFFIKKTGNNQNFYQNILQKNPYLREECSDAGGLFNAQLRTIGSSGSGGRKTGTYDGGSFEGINYYAEPTDDNPFGLNHGGNLNPTNVKNIMIHYSVTANIKNCVDVLGKSGTDSYHYLIEPNGYYVEAISTDLKAQHAGGTAANNNSNTIGICLMNLSRYDADAGVPTFVGKEIDVAAEGGPQKFTIPSKDKWFRSGGKIWQPFPQEQINALYSVISEVLSKFDNIEFICGHEDDTTHRLGKEDPGPAFDQFWPNLLNITNNNGKNLQLRDISEPGIYESQWKKRKKAGTS